MIGFTAQAGSQPRPAATRTWRIAAGLTGAAGGSLAVAGAFLPWVETFAGLIGIPGVRGGYGRALAAAGAVIAAAGVYHAVRGTAWSRWLVAIGGFTATGFCGYLLVQLAVTVRALSGDSMVLARGGPGLWVAGAGSLLAFATVFLPVAPAATRQRRGPARFGAQRAWAQAGWQRVLSRTADLEPGRARRGLQVGLGLVWLLDAVLQFQPLMFGRSFVAQVLMPMTMGNPAAAAAPSRWAAALISQNVAVWNTAFALTQLAIAAGLMWRPAVKAALAASVTWAVAVWWLGEGLGGILTGAASPVTGAPGAVILYALTAVLLWPRHPGTGSVAAGGLLGVRGSRMAWLVLWLSLAYLVLQPAVAAPGALRNALAVNAAGEPGWLAALDRATAAAVGQHGTAVSLTLAATFILIAAGAVVPAATRPAATLAAVTGLAIWVLGENFGQILTGGATDPNTGPLLVLLAATYWPRRATAPTPVTDPAMPTAQTSVQGVQELDGTCREQHA